jgi:lipid-binding SYLF domain-containing protein
MNVDRWSQLGGVAVLALAVTALPASAGIWDKDPEKEKQEIQEIHDETLKRLYAAQPSARQAVEGAVGYAVFSNFGMKILVAGTGTGKGVAIENASRAKTYMRMVEVQAGLGMGVKKFQLVWVFATQEALDQFVDEGWTFGAQASAAAQHGEEGKSYTGALAVAPGVWLYQLLEDGLALELTAKGTKYYKDDDLN